MSKIKVLILGKGYVGSYVYANMALNPAIDVESLSKAELDYTDEYDLREYMKEQRFDYLINAQGFTGRPNVDQAEEEKEELSKKEKEELKELEEQADALENVEDALDNNGPLDN